MLKDHSLACPAPGGDALQGDYELVRNIRKTKSESECADRDPAVKHEAGPRRSPLPLPPDRARTLAYVTMVCPIRVRIATDPQKQRIFRYVVGTVHRIACYIHCHSAADMWFKTMHSQGQLTLTLLHDLALLYLGLAHGVDEDLDPAESRQISASLRRWQPDKDPALIEHVIREATLTYLNGASSERMHEAVYVLKEALSSDVRATILRDFADIARADGEILSQERDFIRNVASEWDLDFDAGSVSAGA